MLFRYAIISLRLMLFTDARLRRHYAAMAFIAPYYGGATRYAIGHDIFATL